MTTSDKISMRDKIIKIAGYNRENGGAMSKAHARGYGVDVDGITWADVPDEAINYGGLTVWVRAGRLLAGVWDGVTLSQVRDITTSIRRVP